MATATATSTQVFTREELDALREALSRGRNGIGSYVSPPGWERERQPSDNWENDIFLLIKFLKDLCDLLQFLIAKRIPDQQRKGFEIIFEKVQEDVANAIEQLRGISGPEDELFVGLSRAGLVGDSLLVKLREFSDRITNGPIAAVLEMGDIILGSLGTVLHLEPLKELKDIIKNRSQFGADDEIIQLHLNS
jgi:hypothetical protein